MIESIKSLKRKCDELERALEESKLENESGTVRSKKRRT